MTGMSQLFCALDQGVGHVQVRDSREFDGYILFGRSLHTDSSGGHHQIAALHRQGHTAAGADADDRIHANLMQLFDSDGRRRTAHSG